MLKNRNITLFFLFVLVLLTSQSYSFEYDELPEEEITENIKMKLLNLFCGTDSVATPWREAIHEVTSVDIDGRFAQKSDSCPLSTHDLLSTARCTKNPTT